MGKVRLVIEMDVPDEFYKNDDPQLRHGLLSQLLFDEVTNYSTCSHIRDAAKWLVESNKKGVEYQKRAKIISESHELWYKILNESEMKVEEL